MIKDIAISIGFRSSSTVKCTDLVNFLIQSILVKVNETSYAKRACLYVNKSKQYKINSLVSE